jgi:hypothetical protein
VDADDAQWIDANDPDAAWFAVRRVFLHPDSTYEEQITIWRTATFEEAEARAHDAASELAGILEARLLPLVQIHRLAEVPGNGAEVFSLLRKSALGPADYLSTFFDTGYERHRAMGDASE